jgi:dsRNA-specific ribonuclease
MANWCRLIHGTSGKSFSKSEASDALSQTAWIGDAVLLLFARSYILRESQQLDEAQCVRMTSNQFLSTFGEPTRVEAQIGQVYEESGLEGAYSWITENLLPLFLKQEENRIRRNPVANVKKRTGRRG